MNSNPVGFGDSNYRIAFYVEHKPNLASCQHINSLEQMSWQQIAWIGQQCGNGWRKQFNVFAKFIYQLNNPSLFNEKEFTSWQQYRDNLLLQEKSKTALIFSPPALCSERCIHIIAGRTYAKSLIKQGKIQTNLIWLNQEFAIDPHKNLIVSPFLDYRQLSNRNITKLIELVNNLIPDIF